MTSLPASLTVHTNDDSKHIAGMNTVWAAPERQQTAEGRKEKNMETAVLHLLLLLGGLLRRLRH